MRHIRMLSTQRPAVAANDYTVITNIISLLSSILVLLSEVTAVFGINFSFGTKGTTQA